MEPMTPDGDPVRLSLGAYVIGALDATERAEVEAHLATCPACREELVALAGLPGLLGRISEREATATEVIDTPASLLERTLGELTRRRRAHRRRLSAAVAAAVIVIAAAGAGTAITYPTSPSRSPAIHRSTGQRVSAVNPATGVRATAEIRRQPWGTAIRLVLSGVAPGQHCQLVALSKDGTHEIAGSWQASYDSQADINGATSIPPDRLAALTVTTTTGADLITLRLPRAASP